MKEFNLGLLSSSFLILSKDDIVVAIRFLYLRNFLQNFSKCILVLQWNTLTSKKGIELTNQHWKEHV
jgi:hypothetical protein